LLLNDSLSPVAQVSLARLLFCLLKVDPDYGEKLGMSSCRTTLLSVLADGTMPVKYFIATNIADIFGLYVLKLHDDVFTDVLENLPTDPESLEGMAFRIFILSELACRWPTLLRRCTYHIFETPAEAKVGTRHATRCFVRISKALHLQSPQDIFALFAPQILYTWLDGRLFTEIPFEVFGFLSLADLLRGSQAEAVGLMVMRDQEEALEGLAKTLSTSSTLLVRANFTKAMGYTVAHDLSAARGGRGTDGSEAEARIKKLVGRSNYLDAVYLNYTDIVALFFGLIDQEDPIEKYLERDENLAYAANVMREIKGHAHSTVSLPPNQQPMFKAKYLIRELFFLSSKTEYEFHNMWTPALVVSVARKLLNMVHPALGSLHACSVLRKVRVLVCLAGPVALESYPLEMLLHSIRRFMVDSECADDALGISKYLILRGTSHLARVPSFLAGYSLSALASLRVFLESSQSSTTQESQFKETMSKAQKFHSWLSDYLAGYKAETTQEEEQRVAFRSITQSASHIRSSGNAEKGTHESNLLMEILQDEQREDRLLNEASRDLAVSLLCGEFKIPISSRHDIIGTDEDARKYSGVIWKSCKTPGLGNDYLAWSGRVVGRSFAASGEILQHLIRESNLREYMKISIDNNGSEQALLDLMQTLTMDKDSFTAGLAESALRTVVSEASAKEDVALLEACQKGLPESLLLASQWSQYRTPPSDNPETHMDVTVQPFGRKKIESSSWLQYMAIYLATSTPDLITLRVLTPILTKVKGFAEQSLPFIVHLVLHSQLNQQQVIKRQFSDSIKEWLGVRVETAKDNVKLLINTILYLRTQTFPNETSIADRSQWLDIDLSLATSAAAWCGMFKTALLFAELASSDSSRASRRSSAAREADNTDVLLSIFENIDDPDAYYGLPQSSSLGSVLARLEYEKDGTKSLAFRGAQYDSHIRRKDPIAEEDSLHLVRALGSLGLSGLSHSLLQSQQSLEGGPASLESTFRTARRLELWNLPAPNISDSQAVTIYKAYQGIHQAIDPAGVQLAIYDGFTQTMRRLANLSMNAAALRHHLGTLAILAELDDILNIADSADLKGVFEQFQTRGQWMRSGR